MRGVGGREWKEGCEGEGDENGRRDENACKLYVNCR